MSCTSSATCRSPPTREIRTVGSPGSDQGMPAWAPAFLARDIGEKRARGIWYLCRRNDTARALELGLVNEVVPLAELTRR